MAARFHTSAGCGCGPVGRQKRSGSHEAAVRRRQYLLLLAATLLPLTWPDIVQGLNASGAEHFQDDRSHQVAEAPDSRRSSAEYSSDAVSESSERIQQIETRATDLYREKEKVEKERRPFVLQRDTLLGEVAQARQRMHEAQTHAVVLERQIAQLQIQINRLAGSLAKELRARQKALEANLKTLLRQIKSARERIEERGPKIQALNLQIAPFDQRLRQLTDELAECRQQWLQIRQPLQKYSSADYEGLRRVLDDWLVLDGHWPEAYAWAALCAYELEDLPMALVYLNKARSLRAEMFGTQKRWPELEALASLIRRKQPGQAAEAEAALSRAVRVLDKQADWQTYFLLGRSCAERPKDAARAQSYLLHALKIEPNCDCAKLWLARLQATSTNENVRDVAAGISTLEQLWLKSDRRSWRLACYLAQAYAAAQRFDEAEVMWKAAAEAAPPEHKQRLAEFRERRAN